MQRILVAVKHPAALPGPALLKAAQLARALGARLEIFHVITPLPYSPEYGMPPARIREVERQSRAQILSKLELSAAWLRRRRTMVSVAAAADAPAYEAVIRRARHISADLIVAGEHTGIHALAGLLKLTDWELLRLSPTPVLLVKTPGIYRHPVVIAAVDPAHANSKPEQLDDRILSVASALTRALKGRLHALHAYIPFPQLDKPHLPLRPAALARLKAELTMAAKQRFGRVLHLTRIRKANRHLLARHPIDAIEQTARRIHGSVVVMGTLSRSGVRGIFLGNTAEAVLDNLECDVLIVKPTGFVSSVPARRLTLRW